MKGTGRILAEESALSLSLFGTNQGAKRAQQITVIDHVTANHCEGGKAKEEPLHAAVMAC